MEETILILIIVLIIMVTGLGVMYSSLLASMVIRKCTFFFLLLKMGIVFRNNRFALEREKQSMTLKFHAIAEEQSKMMRNIFPYSSNTKIYRHIADICREEMKMNHHFVNRTILGKKENYYTVDPIILIAMAHEFDTESPLHKLPKDIVENIASFL